MDTTLSIDRAVTIKAEVAGTVMLDGQGDRRVVLVSSGGVAELIGLNITGGSAEEVSRTRCMITCRPTMPALHSVPSHALFVLAGRWPLH